uniref:DDE_3 domain-containing protein n=1 Tax=Panagrellus redivivus TaxID=6233 RepID=A0A7E4VC12_PANRE
MPSYFGPVLYEDEFVQLTEDMLTIKRYFFPLMRNKCVQTRHLRIAYFDDQESSKYANIRSWGKAANGVYWAVDYRRCLPGDKLGKTNVVIDIEDGVMKGFTVKDVQAFFDSLRMVAPNSLIIVDNLNI